MIYALGAYFLWGILPIFWKQLQSVPAEEIIAHRMLWLVVFLIAILAPNKRLKEVAAAVAVPKVRWLLVITAVVIASNWYVYTWAVVTGRIVEASLGYFINPLVSVLIGVLFFSERPRPLQWTAIAVAAIGVGYLTYTLGRLPWISLFLAFSFAYYGWTKKSIRVKPLPGLTLEAAIMFVPASLFVLFHWNSGDGAFLTQSVRIDILLILCGLVTAAPLLLFTIAAPQLPLTVLGVLQYIAPTLQFLIGVFGYNEPFTSDRLIGFCFVWIALALFTGESLLKNASNLVGVRAKQ